VVEYDVTIPAATTLSSPGVNAVWHSAPACLWHFEKVCCINNGILSSVVLYRTEVLSGTSIQNKKFWEE
jgi:hypothetical protein